MKSAKSIIEHLKHQPRNSKVLEIACYEKVKAFLPPRLAASVLFIYKKNQTLYFVLNHPGMKMEFNYKHTLIKSLLNKLKEVDAKCKDIEINEVKSFVSNKIPTVVSAPAEKKRFFVEKSKGAFLNHAQDKELKGIFEQIKKMLEEKQ